MCAIGLLHKTAIYFIDEPNGGLPRIPELLHSGGTEGSILGARDDAARSAVGRCH